MASPAAFRARMLGAARNEQLRQTGAAFVIKLLGAGGSFVLSFAVARLFGAAGTGSFALGVTTSTIAATLAIFGLDYILLRSVAGDVRVGDTALARGTVRTVVITVAAFALVIAGVLAVAGVPILLQMLGDGSDPGVLRLAALVVLPLALTRIAAASLRGTGSVVIAQWVDGPMAMTINLAILAVLAVTGTAGDVTRVFLLYAGCIAAGTIIAWTIYTRRTRDWAPPADVPVRPLLGMSWKVSISVLSMLFADWLILLLLGAHFGRVEVGQFRTAWQITSLIGLITVSYDTVVGPRLAAAHRMGETATIRKLWRQSVSAMAAGAMPLLVIALVFPTWVLGLFGHDFTAAAPALRILALGQLARIGTGSVGVILLMTGQEAWSLWISLASLALLAGLGVWLIPLYGLAGAAFASSAALVSRNLVMALIAARRLR